MKRLKIGLKLFAIIDVLFSEKFILTTYKNDEKQATTKYDSREFKTNIKDHEKPKNS